MKQNPMRRHRGCTQMTSWKHTCDIMNNFVHTKSLCNMLASFIGIKYLLASLRITYLLHLQKFCFSFVYSIHLLYVYFTNTFNPRREVNEVVFHDFSLTYYEIVEGQIISNNIPSADTVRCHTPQHRVPVTDTSLTLPPTFLHLTELAHTS